MGLDFIVHSIAWPNDRSIDWPSLSDACLNLSEESVDRIDQVHELSELGTKDERHELATQEVAGGIEGLRGALSRGTLHLTIVDWDGWTVLLDGGVTAGAEPTATSYGTEALAASGLLDETLETATVAGSSFARFRSGQAMVDEFHPIGHPSRLIVVAFPADVDWDLANKCLQAEEASLLYRMREVVEGGYSPRATTVRVGRGTLLLGDRADPTGVASQIFHLENRGALAKAGARLVEDIRLRRPIPRNRGATA